MHSKEYFHPTNPLAKRMGPSKVPVITELVDRIIVLLSENGSLEFFLEFNIKNKSDLYSMDIKTLHDMLAYLTSKDEP